MPPVFGAYPRQRYASASPLPGLPLVFLYLTSLRADSVPRNADELVLNSGRGWRTRYSIGSTVAGPGLPFVNWSIQGGDLRAAHFVGLHGMQVLPLIGFIVTRRFANRLSERRRTVLVWIAGLGYLGFVLLLIWQALRGQSVIAPDAVTLGALGGLVGAVALVRWAAFASAKRVRA